MPPPDPEDKDDGRELTASERAALRALIESDKRAAWAFALLRQIGLYLAGIASAAAALYTAYKTGSGDSGGIGHR